MSPAEAPEWDEVIEVAAEAAWEHLRHCSPDQRISFLDKLRELYCEFCGRDDCSGECNNDE
jgi:hypothetical protein